FLGTTAEDKWVAALEAHDALPLPRGANHQLVDRLLLDARAPGTLADTKALRPREATQRVGIHQRVVQHEVCLRDAVRRAYGPKLWITRAGADKGDEAFWHFASRQLPTTNSQLPNKTPNSRSTAWR